MEICLLTSFDGELVSALVVGTNQIGYGQSYALFGEIVLKNLRFLIL